MEILIVVFWLGITAIAVSNNNSFWNTTLLAIAGIDIFIAFHQGNFLPVWSVWGAVVSLIIIAIPILWGWLRPIDLK